MGEEPLLMCNVKEMLRGGAISTTAKRVWYSIFIVVP
jgi:hypothetical protein